MWHTVPMAGLGWGAQKGMEKEPQQVTTQGDTWQAVFLGPPPLGLTWLVDNHLLWGWRRSKQEQGRPAGAWRRGRREDGGQGPACAVSDSDPMVPAE